MTLTPQFRRPDFVIVTATAMSIASLGALVTWRSQTDTAVQGLRISVKAATQRLRSFDEPTTGRSMIDRDFAAALPVDAGVEAVVRELQRLSADSGVVLVAVAGTSQPAAAATLGHADLIVTLRGAYPQLKAIVADTQGRYPNLIVRRLSMHRAGMSKDVEVRAELSLFSRPVSAMALPA